MNTPEINSPCVQICQLNEGNICTGCGRSLNEIAEWSGANNILKQKICDAAMLRLQKMEEHGQNSAE